MFELGSFCEPVGGHGVMLRSYRFSKLVGLRNSEVKYDLKTNCCLTIPRLQSFDVVGFL